MLATIKIAHDMKKSKISDIYNQNDHYFPDEIPEIRLGLENLDNYGELRKLAHMKSKQV